MAFATSARSIGSFGRKEEFPSGERPGNILCSLAVSMYGARESDFSKSESMFVSEETAYPSALTIIFATSARVTGSFGRKEVPGETMPWVTAYETYGAYQAEGGTSVKSVS